MYAQGAPTPEAADIAANNAGLLAACLAALASGGGLKRLALFIDALVVHWHMGACASLSALQRLEFLQLSVHGPLEMGAWTRGLKALSRMHLFGEPLIWSPEAVLPVRVTTLTLIDELSTSLPAQARRLHDTAALRVVEPCAATSCTLIRPRHICFSLQLSQATALASLGLYSWHSLEAEGTVHLASLAGSLRSLDLANTAVLPPSIGMLTNLLFLRLDTISHGNMLLVADALGGMHHLKTLLLSSADVPPQALLDVIAALPQLTHVHLEFGGQTSTPAPHLRPGLWCSRQQVLGASWQLLSSDAIASATRLQQLHLLDAEQWAGGNPAGWRDLFGSVEQHPSLSDVCFELRGDSRLHYSLFEIALNLHRRCSQLIRRTPRGTSFRMVKRGQGVS